MEAKENLKQKQRGRCEDSVVGREEEDEKADEDGHTAARINTTDTSLEKQLKSKKKARAAKKKRRKQRKVAQKQAEASMNI